MKKGMIAGIVLALLIGVPAAWAQDDACLQKGGMWDAAQQKCVQAATIDIKMDYPLSVLQYEFATQAVDQFFQVQRQQFLMPLSDPMFYYSPGPLSLYIDYEEYPYSDTITGLKFNISTYSGGAHPFSFFQTFTFDLANQRVLTLDDLFLPGSNPLTVIGPLVEQSLLTQLGDMTDADWIHTGTGTDPINYQNWILTPGTLTFYFPPYQVAAYAVGPQTVSLPLADLSAILAPDFG
jgi:hypothetical protein